MIDLLVCDRVKQTLTEAILRYVLSLEHSREGCWLPLNESTANLDTNCDTLISDKPRHVVCALNEGGKVGVKSMPPNQSRIPTLNKQVSVQAKTSENVEQSVICNSPNHLAYYHNKAGNNSNVGPRQVNATAAVKQTTPESQLTVTTSDNKIAQLRSNSESVKRNDANALGDNE